MCVINDESVLLKNSVGDTCLDDGMRVQRAQHYNTDGRIGSKRPVEVKSCVVTIGITLKDRVIYMQY